MAQATITLPSLQSSYGFAITPSNSADISADAGNTHGFLWCYVHIAGTSGAVKVDTSEGDTVTLYGVQGTVLGGSMPVQVRRVYSTGTAATSLIGVNGTGGIF